MPGQYLDILGIQLYELCFISEKIVNYLKKEIKSKEIVEINPGLGLVTHFLSKEKFQNLIITEDKKFSINTFNYIMNQEQINLEIKYSNVLEANGKSKEILKNLITESDTGEIIF